LNSTKKTAKKKTKLLQIVKEVLSNPTAPFREQHVREYILRFCKERSIKTSVDRMGNITAVYGKRYRDSKIAFSAHMDHPGFIAKADSRGGKVSAVFYGGVEKKYFAEGAKVRFFTESGEVKGIIKSCVEQKKLRRKKVSAEVKGKVRKGDIGMWDLPAVRIRQDRIYSRACDDLAGGAGLLAMLEELCRLKLKTKVTVIFTAAEEAGLHGAKYICVHKTIPKQLRIIAIETSAQRKEARIGDGVIIRVGDAKSLGHAGLTGFIVDTAAKLKKRSKEFAYQRKLMDGGTCEMTVYQQFGYDSAAICVALGNYHNRSIRTEKIAMEYISVNDLENMVQLFIEIVKSSKNAEDFCKVKTPRMEEKAGKLGEIFITEK